MSVIYRPNPTEADMADPEFEAIWQAIKTWDVDGGMRRGYFGANGSDVMIILNALRESRKAKAMSTKYATTHKLLEENLKALGISHFTIHDSEMFPGVNGSFAVNSSDVLVDLAASVKQMTAESVGAGELEILLDQKDARIKELEEKLQQVYHEKHALTVQNEALAVQNKALNVSYGQGIISVKKMYDDLVGIRANAQYFNERLIVSMKLLEDQFKIDELTGEAVAS